MKVRADVLVQQRGLAESRTKAQARFTADFAANSYASVEELCADPDVDAIYVATPHQYHAEHVTMAAAAGKHVLVEKPMALTLGECRAMTEAVRRAGVQMVIGHSHSFDAPILKTREIIEGGTVGQLIERRAIVIPKEAVVSPTRARNSANT